MPLLLTNEDVKNLLTMNDCIEVLEEAYRELGNGRAVNRPRSQTYVPGSKEGFYHMLKSFDGSIPSMKVSALRLSSDILFGTVVNGKKRRENGRRMKNEIWCPDMVCHNWFETCWILGLVNQIRKQH